MASRRKSPLPKKKPPVARTTVARPVVARVIGAALGGFAVVLLGLIMAALSQVDMAHAQSRLQSSRPQSTRTSVGSVPVQSDQPAFYQADQGTYDRETGIATLTGHVEFWQNDRVLLADRVTYDRNTNVAAATGHVVLMDPDGQTVFSDYAELSGGLKDGVLSGLQALLPEGAK